MGAKGDNARARILECARSLFSTKGYCAVTMKDISEASGFSRGGLYRHFASTEEIFLEIIHIEQTEAFSRLENALKEKLSPDSILEGFLRSRMMTLSKPSHSFDVAVSEFASNSEKGRKVLIDRANDSVRILTLLIDNGNKDGVFSCTDPESTALHILWLLEGLSRHAAIIDITDEEIESHIRLIKCLLQK